MRLRPPPSQRLCYLAQVRRVVRIEATAARYSFDGAVGGDEHQNGVVNRMSVTDPGKRACRTSGNKERFVRVVEIFDQIVDGSGGLIILAQHQYGR